MKINLDAFIIFSKARPVVFATETGEISDDIREAMHFTTEKMARIELEKFDEPEKYDVMKGILQFDF